MSFDINNLTVVGRLTKDPEKRTTQSGLSVCNFSIAVGRGEENVSFFDVTCWKKTADAVTQYMSKGSQVVISGEIVQDRYQDKEGKNKSKVFINAHSVQFVGGKKQDQSNEVPYGAPDQQSYSPENEPNGGLPF